VFCPKYDYMIRAITGIKQTFEESLIMSQDKKVSWHG
jgi:hypothetical protein